jgi:uncharacterized membrane protein
MNRLARWARAVSGLTLFAYPLLLLWGLRHLQPQWLAALLALVWLGRRAFGGAFGLLDHALAGAGLGVAAAAMLGNSETVLRLYPVAVNASFLALFGVSLWRPPSIIERIARRRDPALSPAGVRYTRQVTTAWCVFFVLNGGVALYTAIGATREVWAVYNGVIAYLLIGGMFGGEWLLRRRFLARESTHAG